MARLLLNLQDIHLTFGGKPVLEGAELMLADDERMCLVGRNGSGKSTLLKIAAGLVEPDGGERWLQPGTTVRYLPPYSPDLNPIEQVFAKLKAMLRKAQARTADALWSIIGELLDRFACAECEHYIRHCGYCGSG